MAFAVQDLSRKHIGEGDIIQILNDTVKLTREILNNCYIRGKDSAKVNILNAYFDLLNEATEKEMEKVTKKRVQKKQNPVRVKAWTTADGGMGSLHRVSLELEGDKVVNVIKHPEDMPHIVYAKILREMQYESKED